MKHPTPFVNLDRRPPIAYHLTPIAHYPMSESNLMPLSGGDQSSSGPQRYTKVLCVANQKGGVGKTTTAVNLAASLAYRHKQVLLIDLDQQANATIAYGINKNELTATIYQVLLGLVTLPSVMMSTEMMGLKIVPSNRDLAAAEIEIPQLDRKEFRLADALATVRADFDFILIDCPPALSYLTINALTAADGIIIPMQCEYFALEGLTDLIDSIRRIQSQLNPSLGITGLLRVMYDKRATLSQQVSAQLEKHFHNVLFATQIPRNVRLAEAPSYGKPAILFDPVAPGTVAYLDLADEILKTY